MLAGICWLFVPTNVIIGKAVEQILITLHLFPNYLNWSSTFERNSLKRQNAKEPDWNAQLA